MAKREINVDLFRLIATVFVIVLHILGMGGILRNSSPDSSIYWGAWFLEILTYCAVNCFALISGYVMVERKIKAKNIISVWFQLFFYSVSLTGLIFLWFPNSIGIKNVVKALLPVLTNQWWYMSSYFALFFFIPFLNAALNNLSKETVKKFLIVILLGVCFLDCVLPTDPFVVGEGYSALWLIILYVFGAYIKKYDVKQKITAIKSILWFFGLVVLTFLSKFVISFVTIKHFGQIKSDNIFVSYCSITITLASIFLFLFCLNIRINKTTQKVVGFFAPASLGVYLIHVQPLVFEYIFKDAFVSFIEKPVVLMFVYVIVSAFAIFIVCSAIELLRIQLFKIIKVHLLCQKIDDKIQNVFLRLFKNNPSA